MNGDSGFLWKNILLLFSLAKNLLILVHLGCTKPDMPLKGTPTCSESLWRITMKPLLLGYGNSSHHVKCMVSRRISGMAMSDTEEGLDENRLVRTPESFQEIPGRLTSVNKFCSSSPEDLFHCSGCEDSACRGAFGCAGFSWRMDPNGYVR